MWWYHLLWYIKITLVPVEFTQILEDQSWDFTGIGNRLR
jgi:hypothetical protein